MLCLALLGKACDMVLRAIENRMLGWRDTFAPESGRP
jgi:hypothetical protein